MKKKSELSAKRRVEVQVHRRKREFLDMFRELAWNADEAGFKTYLTDHCGIKPGDAEYPGAMSEFWNLVRALENERRR